MALENPYLHPRGHWLTTHRIGCIDDPGGALQRKHVHALMALPLPVSLLPQVCRHRDGKESVSRERSLSAVAVTDACPLCACHLVVTERGRRQPPPNGWVGERGQASEAGAL